MQRTMWRRAPTTRTSQGPVFREALSTPRLSPQGSGGAGLRSREMSRARLASLASVVLAVVLLAGLGWIGWLLYDSRLPGSYNAMDLAVPDYGGGVHASHGGMSGRTVEQLHGPEGLVPDFRRTLIARRATVELQSGRRIEALTYEGRVPGPELVVRQGDLVEVTLVNQDISEGAAIHWHGVDLPNREDGVP